MLVRLVAIAIISIITCVNGAYAVTEEKDELLPSVEFDTEPIKKIISDYNKLKENEINLRKEHEAEKKGSNKSPTSHFQKNKLLNNLLLGDEEITGYQTPSQPNKTTTSKDNDYKNSTKITDGENTQTYLSYLNKQDMKLHKKDKTKVKSNAASSVNGTATKKESLYLDSEEIETENNLLDPLNIEEDAMILTDDDVFDLQEESQTPLLEIILGKTKDSNSTKVSQPDKSKSFKSGLIDILTRFTKSESDDKKMKQIDQQEKPLIKKGGNAQQNDSPNTKSEPNIVRDSNKKSEDKNSMKQTLLNSDDEGLTFYFGDDDYSDDEYYAMMDQGTKFDFSSDSQLKLKKEEGTKRKQETVVKTKLRPNLAEIEQEEKIYLDATKDTKEQKKNITFRNPHPTPKIASRDLPTGVSN